VWFLFALAVAGCGQGSHPACVPVEGTVTLNGKPLPGAIVEFYPVVAPGEAALPFSRGQTDASGRYQLKCDNRQAGAVVGKHRVVVRLAPTERDPDAPPKKTPASAIPVPYLTASQTPLEVEVAAGQSVHDLALKGR
jgi:hypothetical protein